MEQCNRGKALNPYDIAPILKRIVSRSPGVKDIIFTSRRLPFINVAGRVESAPLKDLRSLTDYQMELLALGFLKGNPMALKSFLEIGSASVSYSSENAGHYRVNIFKTRNSIGVVMRVVPQYPPTMDSLGLPRSLAGLAEFNSGLLLFTGLAGSGKSSTLAAALNLLAQHRSCHIVTLEQPVEFRFHKTKSLVHQLEVGSDVPSYLAGLRAAKHQAASILMVGEIDGADCLEAVLEAVDSGMLVLSTLPTGNAVGALRRLLRFFPVKQEGLIRSRLGRSIRCVVSQKLLPRKDNKGVVPVVEILKNNDAVRNYIRKSPLDEATLADVIGQGAGEGMQSFQTDFKRLAKGGLVAVDAFRSSKPNTKPVASKPAQTKSRELSSQREIELDDSIVLDVAKEP